MTRANILYVVNKKLPANDYRINYPHLSTVADVWFGMPGRTETVNPDRYVKFNFKEGLRPSYFLEFMRLWRFLRQNRTRFDLAHFFSTNLVLFGPLVAFLAGVPSVVTVTGFGRIFSSPKWHLRMLKPFYRALFSLSVHLAESVLFQNRTHMQMMIEQLPHQAGKLEYIGSAISGELQPVKSMTEIVPWRVLLVARLIPDKGIDDFLNVARLFYDNPALQFVLIGPPSFGFDALHATVQAVANEGTIEYLGELEPKQTQSALRTGHIFFFPSSYGEGLPRVMLEAGYAGLCPIAYDIPATKDLLDAGRGFLIEPGNWMEAAETIERLLNEPALADINAIAYQKFICTHYNMEAYANRMDRVVTQIIDRFLPTPVAHSADDTGRHNSSN